MPYFRFTCAALAFAIWTYALDSSKPDLSGTWKLVKVTNVELSKQLPNEIYTFTQRGDELLIKMDIKDRLGDRTFDLAAKLDGKPYEQKCAGSPCTITAKWDGNTLVWSLAREITVKQGKFRIWNERKMHLSDDRHIITAERTTRQNDQERQWTETWERQ
jgi:hypothetical protein